MSDSRLRVLILGKDAFRAGMQREIAYTLKYIDKTRFDVMILLPRGGTLVTDYARYARTGVYEPLGVTKIRQSISGWLERRPSLGAAGDYWSFSLKRREELNQQRWIAKQLESFAPHVVVWHYHYPIRLFKPIEALKQPSIQHIQLRFATLSGMDPRDLNHLFVRSSTFVCEGVGIRNELVEYAGVAQETIHRIPMPLDMSVVTEQIEKDEPSARTELGIPGDALVITAISSPLFVKGVDLWLRAAAELLKCFPEKQLYFVWVGGEKYLFSNVYGMSVLKLANELGIMERVRFVGEKDDVYPYLKMCDIFVQPSRIDAFPHTPLEAMAIGKPVVSSRLGIAEEEFAQDALIGVPVNSAPALTEGIARVISDEGLRRTIAENGARLVSERYDAVKNVPMYETLLEDTARSGNRTDAWQKH